MAWKQSGQPTIQQQRGKWVARVEGIDTETGKRRPRQIGTFSSKRAAQRAATAFAASGDALAERDTVARTAHPSDPRVVEARTKLREVRHSNRVDEVFDRWANPADRTTELRTLHGALDDWKRWASGKDVPEQQLAAAFAALSTTSRPGCGTLAAALAPAVPNHMLGPASLEVEL